MTTNKEVVDKCKAITDYDTCINDQKCTFVNFFEEEPLAQKSLSDLEQQFFDGTGDTKTVTKCTHKAASKNDRTKVEECKKHHDNHDACTSKGFCDFIDFYEEPSKKSNRCTHKSSMNDDFSEV